MPQNLAFFLPMDLSSVRGRQTLALFFGGGSVFCIFLQGWGGVERIILLSGVHIINNSPPKDKIKIMCPKIVLLSL